MTEQLNPILKAYRKNETLPTKFSLREIVDTLNGLHSGIQAGLTGVTAGMLGDKMLLEGRGDAGTNEFNTNNKRAVALNKTINKEYEDRGVEPPRGAITAAAFLDKQEVAKRLNIPFELAWNGTGKNTTKGADGQRHAARAEKMAGAIDDPRNSAFKDIIERGLAGNLTPQEQATQIPWDTLRSVFAGTNKLAERGQDGDSVVYTKEAKDNLQGAIYNIVTKDLKLSPKRAEAVFKDLQDSTQLLNNLPKYWQEAAGLKAENMQDVTKYTPDTWTVLDKIIGKN